MTEYEFLELAYDYGVALTTDAVNVMTVFFAYVVAAHFVGDKLPKAFAYFMTLSYSLFLLGPFTGIYGRTDAILGMAAQYRIAYPDGAFFHGSPNRLVMLGITLLPPLRAWCGSIVYMHGHVRRNTGDRGAA